MTHRHVPDPPDPTIGSDPTRSLAELTEHERELAFRRFEILRPCIERGVAINKAAKSGRVGRRTAQRWLAAYRRGGLVALARAQRSDRGRPRKIDPELEHLIEGLALQKPAPSVAAIHRQVIDVASRREWAAPSYGSVYAIVRNLDPALVCLAVDGSKAYRERFDLIHRREATGPNEIWQADHTLLDLWIRDEGDALVRPWLTCILDDYSRAVCGYRIGLEAPSALVTSLALREAIWRKDDSRWHVCGIPDILYTDHGSDFTSRHLDQVAADLKMRLVFSIPGMPRGRGRIERFFETINQLSLCHLPGYASAGQVKPGTPLTLQELRERFRDFVLDDYHHRQHGGTGLEPQPHWEAHGFLPRIPDSLEQLDLLLLTVAKSRRVRPDGIRFQNFRYIDPTLAGYVGEDVTIRYDPCDLAEIRVFHNERFVCRAICQELAGSTVGLKDVIRARNRRRRELRGSIENRNAVVEQLLAVHQPLEEPETPPSCSSSKPAGILKRYRHD